jgi:hypothetical protein
MHAQLGRQWNLTKVSARGVDQRKVCTPKPSIMRRLRGMPRSDITHISMWMVSGISEMKSQKVSCADCGLRHLVGAVRASRRGSGRELHRVLDEEDRDVVADQVPVALGV